MSDKPQYPLRKRMTFWLVYIVLVVLFFEFAFRAFFALSYKNATIILKPFAAIDHYYPGIWNAMNTNLAENDSTFDILMLGGSVLSTHWGKVEESLNNFCEDSLATKVRIHNLACAAHTSRDSRNKLFLLRDKPFEAIFLYHGINSTRFNNCPSEIFKPDYAHVDFYAKVNGLVANELSRYSIVPILVSVIKTNVLRSFAEENYLPFHAPTRSNHADWIKYGTNIKTADAEKDNLNYIISEAHKADMEFITASFVYYIPSNYSLSAFKKKHLDYNCHKTPVELWGTVETVSKGIDAHNEALQKIADSHQNDSWFHNKDVNAIFPKSKTTLDDLCHFTHQGSLEFARHIFPMVKKAVAQKQMRSEVH